MCGLVGMAGTLDRSLVNAFNNLLIFNMVRGYDSTGVASVDRDSHKERKDTYLFKAPVDGYSLQLYKNYDRVVSQGKVCIIGHGRAATVGKINRENAHPFEFSDLIGAHNGTIHNRTGIPDASKFDTDSEALYNAINILGVEAVIPELSSGAWALTWYDKRDHSINMLRNKERPLVFAIVEDDKALVWSSETQILHAALLRNGIKTEEKVFVLPEDTWYKWIIPKNHGAKFGEPIIKELKGKEAPKVEYTHSNFPQRGQHVSQLPRRTSVDELARVEKTQAAKVVVFSNAKKKTSRKVIMGWNGRQLDRSQYENMTGSTCAFSDQVVTWEDVVDNGAEIVFINETQFICSELNTPEMHNWYFGVLAANGGVH